jgi:hypothetical protein
MYLSLLMLDNARYVPQRSMRASYSIFGKGEGEGTSDQVDKVTEMEKKKD